DVMTEVGEEPALFFLDPFGVEGLLSQLLPPALSGPHNEIFALFSDIGAVRLHAVLAASERDADREVMKVLLQRNLFVEEETRTEEEKRAAVARSTASLQATKVAARRILSGALGPERVRELDSTPPHLRDAKAVEMYIRLLVESGSRFVLPLRIRDESGNPKYHLVHASKSASGFQAMKEAMHSAFGKSTLPDDVLRKMSFDKRLQFSRS
ncbi:MAG: hypothetical protein IH876_14785, partial [Gemmatimonadetes bacterium]|nr:hypothetical protein [Gemmatimonadota bacterium]